MHIYDTFKTFFDMGGARRRGVLMKMNRKTIWVKIMIGVSDYVIIKRHARKHRVRFYPVYF